MYYAGTSTATIKHKEMSVESATMEDTFDNEEAGTPTKKKCIDASASKCFGWTNFANHFPTAISYLAQPDSY